MAMEIKTKAVILYEEGTYSAKEIERLFNVPERTLRDWTAKYRRRGLAGLACRKTGPKGACDKKQVRLRLRILQLKRKYPMWGADRLTHQFDLSCCSRTTHRVLKKKNLLVRRKKKPQPCKRFARKHVDSMWQGDTFQFRVKRVGKVYLTGFTDDCSRYRIVTKTYLHKGAAEAINTLQWALKRGRVPKQIYLDNGKQFIAKAFKKEAKKHGIKLIYGRPYHPRGRGKIENYHKTLYAEVITQKKFKSLSHIRKEMRKYDCRYNNWRKQQALGWNTPASVYNNAKYFNKKRKLLTKNRQEIVSGKRQ